MNEPALSVVLAGRTGWGSVARTVDRLASQDGAGRIEVVLVSLSGPAGDPPPSVARLAGQRVVSAAGCRAVAAANAIGARAARAPVVVFGEDHAFPEPGWAAALIARHEEPWAVVGPVVRNANPATATSWADFVLGYASHAEGHPGGEVAMAPGHNSAYKRAVLERHDAHLEEALAAEWVFHARLRDEGERIYLEPMAVVSHANFSRRRAFAAVTFRAARAGAATRAAGWSPARRAAFTAGSAVLPALRLTRALRVLPRAQRRTMPARALPGLVAGLVIDAAGQAVGFAAGRPDAARDALADLELERIRFVTPADAAALT